MKQGKSQKKSNNKSNNKSLGKQEQIYYLLSQHAGNNNKLMKKRLQNNKNKISYNSIEDEQKYI